MRTWLLPLAALVAAPIMAMPTTAHAASQRTVVLGKTLAVEGAPEECVTSLLGQGLTLQQAAEFCQVALGFSSGGVAVAFGGTALPDVRNGESGPVNVSCATAAGVDPTMRQVYAPLVTWSPGDRTPAEKELDAHRMTPHPDDPGPQMDWDRKERELLDAAERSRLPADPEPAHSPPGGSHDSGDGGGKVHHAVDGVTNACAGFAAFVGECNLAGWATSPCQMLRNQMGGCADQTIAYTEDGGATGCRLTVDVETIKTVVDLRCSKMGKVMPGFDPCAPKDLGGGVGIYRLPNGDPCRPGTNEYNTGEDCARTFDDMLPEGFDLGVDLGVLVVLGGPGAPSLDPEGPPVGCWTC